MAKQRAHGRGGTRSRHVRPSIKSARQAAAVFTASDTSWQDANEVMIEILSRGLASVRKGQGLTQAELGKKLGLPQSRISKIEGSPDSITVRLLRKIARALAKG